MKRNFKTSENNRTTYRYYSVDGTKIEIVPGESGVSEIDIEILHSLDDEEVNENRRYEYRVTTHLDAYDDGGSFIEDSNKYMRDNDSNPILLLVEKEDKLEHENRLDKLKHGIKSLLPNQQELFKKKFVENRTNTDIALEENVTEAAIRKRLKNIKNKLGKSFC
ncbi:MULTISPECIES: sigma-70 RNA polymerase sigma factor region 4 domain-containing protein [Terrisporobacter]|uniref:RNA polymerase subunit sigma-24 n=2 Tax=Terrisporobacter TaxID=1505652 RepID=A0A0B3VJ96_9FIRM|nr:MULTISPECIES: sigma-70 family RNA polymerase sigma factor [Terrisporobacter]KHS56846.1 RNA polymerase subunit sigma-24 [Terrisporobacter othiniensis]MCR1822023.1 sigma-70 family RNA polymerase sigma factor [Terrisporobacter muris]